MKPRVVLLSILAACVLVASAPASSADDVIDRADWQERAYFASGALVEDEPVQAYVRDVAQRVNAKDAPPLRVAVLRDSDAFAFALPNGAIYVSAGLLTRIRTESELAAVLAREAALVTGPTGAALSGGSGRVDLGLVAFGAESPLPRLYAPSTIRGVKEEAERAADELAVERLVASGYDATAAAGIHEALARQARNLKAPRSFAYTDVGRMEARARSLGALARGRSSANTMPDRYAGQLRDFVLDACERFAHFGRPELAIAALADAGRADSFGSIGHRILADAYRLRREKGDDARARAEYDAALQSDRPDPRAHLGAAQLASEARDAGAAAMHYDEYLRSAATGAPERAFAVAERALLERAR